MKLLVVIPLSAADIPYVLSMATALKACGKNNNNALIVADHALSSESIAPVLSALEPWFWSVSVHSTPITLADQSYPMGHNFRFESAARAVGANHWLWLDPRCVPMRKGWLQEIESAYTGGFMGQILTPQKHGTPALLLSSVAVYPPGLPKRIMQRLIAQRNVDWERSCANLTVPLAKDTPLIWIQPSIGKAPLCWPSHVPKEACLAHTGASRSLIRALYSPSETKPVEAAPELKLEPPKPISRTNYYHSGNLGDIAYALYAIRKAGGGKIIIGPKQRRTPAPSSPVKQDGYELLQPLLDAQAYISGHSFTLRHPGTDNAFDLNLYRANWTDAELRKRLNINTIIRMHCHLLGVDEKFDHSEPWITAPNPIRTGMFVCHRSQRYRSEKFPWDAVVKRFKGRLLFTGLPVEHNEFQRDFGVRVAYWNPTDFLEMANLIAGSEGFIGNQSFPMAVALGLGKRVLQESWEQSPDCLFARDNFLTQPFGEKEITRWAGLPELVSEDAPKKVEVVAPDPERKWYPSIFEQTEWPCGMFDFKEESSGNQGVCHFNPSIELIGDKLHLFTRRFAYRFNSHPREGMIGNSDIAVWGVAPDKTVSAISRLSAATLTPTNQWEDPRTIQHNGKLFLSAVTWDSKAKPAVVRQSLYEVSPELNTMKEVTLFPHVDSVWEKNWTYFIQDGAWHLIYKLAPYSVFRLDAKWKGVCVNNVAGWDTGWKYGTPRGGTNPIRVGDEWWTFFHSSMPWRGNKRRYFMGALALSAKAPFAVTRYTKTPLLVGSEEDPRHLSSPCVVFPCGSVFRDSKWLVTFGVNDENSGWIEIPHAELEPLATKP